jgi:hypothetical protein
MDFLGKQGIEWEVFPAARNPFQRPITGKRWLSSHRVSNLTY